MTDVLTITTTNNLVTTDTTTVVIDAGYTLPGAVVETVPVTSGGTGQTTQQAALNTLAGAVTNSEYLRGNGTNVSMSAIQVSDVPTLNQNTTGTASNITGTAAIVNGGTGATTASAALSNLGALPVAGGTITGDLIVGGMLTASVASQVDWLSVKSAPYNATGNGQLITDAAMSSGSAVLTSNSNLFSSTDVGKLVMVDAAGSGGLNPPAAPTVSAATSGGTVAAGNYQVEIAYVNALGGVSVVSASTPITTTSSTSTITINSPATATGATSWYAYVTQVSGSTYTMQQTVGSPTAIGTNLTLTATPTSTGNTPQFTATGAPLAATITGYTSAGSVTLSTTASTTVAGVACYWGTDDTAALNAALSALTTTSNHGGQNVPTSGQCLFVPRGIYMTSSALAPQAGRGFSILGDWATIVATQSNLIDFETSSFGSISGHMEISGLVLEGCGGHVIANSNIQGLLNVHDCVLTMRNTAYCLFYIDSVATGHENGTYRDVFENITYYQGFGTRSIPMWYIVSGSGANTTDIAWRNVFGPFTPGSNTAYRGLDNTQPQYYVYSEGADNDAQPNPNLTWRDVTTGNCFGGIIQLYACKNVTIENISIGNTYGQTITNDLFYFGPSTQSGTTCSDIILRNIYRANGFGPGENHTPGGYDINLDSTCSNVLIEVLSIGTLGGQGPFINVGNASQVVVICGQSWNDTLEIYNQAPDTLVISGTTLTVGGVPFVHNQPSPGDNGLAVWNFDPMVGTTTGSTLVAGTIYLQQVPVHRQVTVSKAWVAVVSAGSSATTGQNFLGLYNSSGTLLGSVADDTLVTATSGMSERTLTVASGQSLTLAPGKYYVAILLNAGSMPSWMRGIASGAYVNFNSTTRAGVGGTSQTSLPSSVTITATGNLQFWAGLS